nr:hypothetical protein 1 [bacterium]
MGCCINKYKQKTARKIKTINLNVQNGGSVEFINIRARDYKIPSKKTRAEAGKRLIELINNAKNNIYFFSYGLSEQPQIITALENAYNRGVRIEGLVDKNVFGRNDYTGTLKAIEKFPENTIKSDYESDMRKKARIDNKIEPYKYKFFYGHIMHNKIFVIDDEYIWLGSCNISSTGTGGYNENIVSIIKSRGLSKYFKTEFSQMYDKDHFHQDKDEIYSKEPVIFDDNSKVYIYFSPSQKALNEGVIPRINLAKKRIYISMFLITQQDIVNALIKAKKRGVDVKLIIEANHASEKYSKHNELRKAGIPVKIEDWGGKMHSKAAIIDDNCVISGSTNWTFTAFNYNDENLLIFDDLPPETVNKLVIEFQNSYNSIPEKWLYGIPKAEGPDSTGACFDGIDNDHDRFIDMDDFDCAGFDSNRPHAEYDYDRVRPHPKVD